MIFKYIFLLGCWTTCTLSLLKVFLETCRSAFLELFPRWLLRVLGSLAKNTHLLLLLLTRQYSDLQLTKVSTGINYRVVQIYESWRFCSHLFKHSLGFGDSTTYSLSSGPNKGWSLREATSCHTTLSSLKTQNHLKQTAFFTVMKHWNNWQKCYAVR